MRRVSILTLSFGLVLAALLWSVPALRGTAQTAPATGFIGSWRQTVTPAGKPAVLTLLTVFADGTFLVSSPPVAPAPKGAAYKEVFGSAGHGVWQSTGSGTAATASVRLRTDETGANLGTVVVRASLRLGADGQTFSGSYINQTVDPAGTVTATTRGTLTAVRIIIEPVGAPAATPGDS